MPNSQQAEAPYVLEEYDSAIVTLEPAQERLLRTLARHRLSVRPEVGDDRWRLTATSHVGTIVAGDVRILVKPKVDVANLFHMLEAGGEALAVGDEQFEYETSTDLVAAFATFYARHLERALGLGLPRSYVEHDDRLVTIRGRIDLPGMRRSAGLPIPVPCRFDEYTADVQLNRILRAAALRLIGLPGVTATTRRALVGLVARLEDVGDLAAADLVTPTKFTRLNRHCEAAERLARMVLDASSLVDSEGSTGAHVFMVDMNKVFEQFVAVRLRRYLRDRLVVLTQVPTHLDRQGQIGMAPDLVFGTSDNRTVYVADTKYKVTADGFARGDDYYQLLAYATALDVPEGLLIYCRTDDTPLPQQVDVSYTGHRLCTLAVRLDGSIEAIEAEMIDLSNHIAQRVDLAGSLNSHSDWFNSPTGRSS